jgi:UDP-sugar transporter A1/2/3
MFIIACCSGFSSVYFEKVLKSTTQITIFERNFQLALWSILFCIAGLLFDYKEISEKGFFHEYVLAPFDDRFSATRYSQC